MKFVRVCSVANALLLCGLIVAVTMGAATAPEHPEALTLVSEDGKSRIEISAAGETPGIWISRNGQRGRVALYTSRNEGAVIGCWGGDKPAGPLDVCLSATRKGDGQLQLVSGSQKPSRIAVLTAETLRD